MPFATIAEMDFPAADTYDVVVNVVSNEESVNDGMARLVAHCAHLSPDAVWSEIGKLDFDGDAKHLTGWLMEVLVAEPPRANIAAFWFGLFDRLGPDGRGYSSLYMAGTATYDPADSSCDCACWPAYLPKCRYAESVVLRSISGLLAGRHQIVSSLGSYVLPLAYAALAVRKAECSIPAEIWLGGRTSRAVAVGFDSGDIITLPQIKYPIREPI
jgi:hypothetical protein